MSRPDSPEVGRELNVEDLKPPVVVWLVKKGSYNVISVWAESVTKEHVVFFSDVFGYRLLTKRTADGGVADDTNTPLLMYEYLGEPCEYPGDETLNEKPN